MERLLTTSMADAPDVATLPEVDHEVRRLPPFKVILHNDDVNEFDHVIAAILKLTPLDPEAAVMKTLEAHEEGQSVLLVTTKERAELYCEQFATFNLTVTAEPDE